MRYLALAIVAASSLAWGADKYTGPIPPKADMPYLLHADNLVETEKLTAKEESRKDSVAYTMPGETSPARTPLAEPIFLLKPDKLTPEKFALYRMDVKNGNREVVISQKRNKNNGRPVPLIVTRVADGLYKIEVDQQLENGQYTLSPDGTNDAFAFEIY